LATVEAESVGGPPGPSPSQPRVTAAIWFITKISTKSWNVAKAFVKLRESVGGDDLAVWSRLSGTRGLMATAGSVSHADTVSLY